MGICMTPDQYYHAFVLENYYDYKDNLGCVRRAFNVAVATSHLADQFFTYYKRNDPSKVSGYDKIGDYLEHIEKSTMKAFRDLRSIANAYKHLYTGDDPQKEQYSTISSAGAIETVQIEDEDVRDVYENYSFEEVYYTTKTGDKKSFNSTLDTVIDYWKTVFGY